MRREHRRWLRAARQAGWRVERIKQGYKLFPSNGADVIILHTGHGAGRYHGRHLAAKRSEFRRAGLDM